MKILRTPDERFVGLADYPFAPHYTTIQTDDGSDLRIHHLDEGPKEGPLVLCACTASRCGATCIGT
jgi:haloalkane dehalogenase